jgi:hypothetical protein
MSIFDKPPEPWIEDDLRELLGPPPQRETPTLEFKRELSLRTEGEKAEAEKDIEGLANHGEGVFIYGIAETVMEDGSRAAGELTPVARPLAEHLNNPAPLRTGRRKAFVSIGASLKPVGRGEKYRAGCGRLHAGREGFQTRRFRL